MKTVLQLYDTTEEKASLLVVAEGDAALATLQHSWTQNTPPNTPPIKVRQSARHAQQHDVDHARRPRGDGVGRRARRNEGRLCAG